MNTKQKLVLSEAEGCDNCGEELGSNPVRRGGKVYCCEACAFEVHYGPSSRGVTRKVRFGLS
jgi:hypothetical protein